MTTFSMKGFKSAYKKPYPVDRRSKAQKARDAQAYRDANTLDRLRETFLGRLALWMVKR